MKRIVSMVIALVLLIIVQNSVFASSMEELKTTFTLGPFKVSEPGIVLSSSETEVRTINATYVLQSLEGIGVSDDLIESMGIEQLNEITAHYLVERMQKDGINAEIYKNPQGLYGLFYTLDVGGSTILTIMIVHGKDCIITTTNYDSEPGILSYYAHLLMDNYSLDNKKN